jgi:hypothetical protein
MEVRLFWRLGIPASATAGTCASTITLAITTGP